MKAWLHECVEKLESIPATIISGVCILASLLIPLIIGVDIPMYLDPAWIAVVISGIPLLYLAIRRVIVNRGIQKISSALLITVGMIASIAIGDIFAAGEIAFIMAIGEVLENLTVSRAKRGLKKLIGMTPVQGRKVTADGVSMISAEEICVGDIIRVLPGETIPIDGVIISGETSVDQSVMTGESLPVDKACGDQVFGGTVNRFGSVDIRATKVGEDASLQRLIRMVKESEEKKAPIARIADKWAAWLVPVALLLALGSGLAKYLMGDPDFLTVGVTMLVVFCPCALVLATPTAIMAAIGQATKHGVIIKSGEALEKMGMVDTIAFDKTGTLTTGRLHVADVFSFDSAVEKAALLRMTAAAESRSEHPLGKAIVAHALTEKVALPEAQDFSMTVGKGISARVEGKLLLCGNLSFIQDKGVIIPETVMNALDTATSEGKASVLVAVDGRVCGLFTLSDTMRPGAKEMVEQLKGTRTDVTLLTGDHETTARYFAAEVGIEDVRAKLLPEDKVSAVEDLKASGRRVCLIGDGVNDAPALKTADVSIAMGTMGSDLAIEAADIALMGDDISKVPYLKRLSNATLNTIRLSISLSLIINVAAIVLSFFELLNPTTGALMHNAGSIFVILIAALLYDRKFK